MPGLMPSLEAQIIDLADEIAYNNHDLDDGLTSGLLDRNEVKELEIWKMAEIAASSGCKKPSSGSRTIIRGIINILATDCIETTAKRISEKKIDSYDAVIHSGEKIIGLSDEIKSANADLKSFLNEKLYRHSRVLRMTIKAEMVVRNLFEIFINHPGTLPCDYFKRINGFNTQEIVTDYIAGMTDRYAIEEHSDLTDPKSRA
jgi:dGTPase